MRTDAPTYRTAFAYRSFYAKVPSHTKKLGRADAFNQRKFWNRSFYTQVLWYREGFYTQTLLHQGAVTRRIFHTQTLSGTRAFSQRKTIHKSYHKEKAPTQESFLRTHTQEHLRREASGTGSAQDNRNFTSTLRGSRAFPARRVLPEQVQQKKLTSVPQFWTMGVTMSCGKGSGSMREPIAHSTYLCCNDRRAYCAGTVPTGNPNLQVVYFSFHDDRHEFRSGLVRRAQTKSQFYLTFWRLTRISCAICALREDGSRCATSKSKENPKGSSRGSVFLQIRDVWDFSKSSICVGVF